MQPKLFRSLLLVTGAFLLLTAFSFYSSKSSTRTLTTPPTLPAEPVAVVADDNYYKIPDSVTYNGQQMLNKAGLLSLSTELGHNYYLVRDTANNTGFIYAEVKAGDYTPADKTRAPLNIALVIDRSGSMTGAKLDYVKKAADFLIDKLNDKDILSIVVYESQVGVLQKSVPVTDKKYLHDVIASIETAGGTNLGGGMIEGFNQVKNTYKSGYVNRVLLLSDGLANEGISDPIVLQNTAKKWFNGESISISTFGVGNDYNENLMTGLAENGGGNYYYIKEPTQIPTLFEKEINGLLSLVAKQATLKFTLPQQIVITRVYGGNYEMDRNVMTVNLKDIFANETKGILVKFKIKPEANTELPIVTHLDFEDATQNNQKSSIENLNLIKPITDKKTYLSNFSERVMQQCTMFESNDLLEQTMKAVDDGNYDKARSLGVTTQTYLWTNKAKFAATKEIQKQDSVVGTYNVELKTIESKNANELKEVQKVSKSYNYEIRKKK
jgi:Ca-activated chloride channel family protein